MTNGKSGGLNHEGPEFRPMPPTLATSAMIPPGRRAGPEPGSRAAGGLHSESELSAPAARAACRGVTLAVAGAS